jgi:hypothetical protein
MITADTSTWVAFLDGTSGDDIPPLKKALQGHQLPNAAVPASAIP